MTYWIHVDIVENIVVEVGILKKIYFFLKDDTDYDIWSSKLMLRKR